jgi:hypothetical protein
LTQTIVLNRISSTNRESSPASDLAFPPPSPPPPPPPPLPPPLPPPPPPPPSPPPHSVFYFPSSFTYSFRHAIVCMHDRVRLLLLRWNTPEPLHLSTLEREGEREEIRRASATVVCFVYVPREQMREKERERERK